MIRRVQAIAFFVAAVQFVLLIFSSHLAEGGQGLKPIQSVQGAWEGTMSHGTDSFSQTWKITLIFEQKGATITGSTRIDAPPNFATFALKGELKEKVITAVEGAILEEDSSELGGEWCKQRSMKLILTGDNQLEGTWDSPTSGCSGGRIVARRLKVEEQRDKAKRLACSSPPGSLGKEAICPYLDFLAVLPGFGSFCAGDVGDLYESNKRLLEATATDENIQKWAALETKHFQAQRDCSSNFGEALSEGTRFELMKLARGPFRN